LTLAGNGRTGRKTTCGKGKRAMTNGRLEPNDREGPDRNSAWSQQGDEPQPEIDCGSSMQELMERGHLWRYRHRCGILLYFILMK
jgi:hypothetical protein